MDKDINQIKVVLAEKRKQTNGWQNSLDVHQPQFQNGVLTLVNHQ